MTGDEAKKEVKQLFRGDTPVKEAPHPHRLLGVKIWEVWVKAATIKWLHAS